MDNKHTDRHISLTRLRIPGYDNEPLVDLSGSFHDASANVYFRDLEQHLCKHIEEADVVVGAVAWLTSRPILESLAKVPHGVSIVVQKEDFLRPDVGNLRNWPAQLRQLYQQLPLAPQRGYWPILRTMNYCSDAEFEPVRCMGNYNRNRDPAFPRMHNKFLVFLKADNSDNYHYDHINDEWHESDYSLFDITPYAVWTGSFNMTKNATMSFENALYVRHPGIANRYLKEWTQIMALSEPLDWESDWCSPEWEAGKS